MISYTTQSYTSGVISHALYSARALRTRERARMRNSGRIYLAGLPRGEGVLVHTVRECAEITDKHGEVYASATELR